MADQIDILQINQDRQKILELQRSVAIQTIAAHEILAAAINDEAIVDYMAKLTEAAAPLDAGIQRNIAALVKVRTDIAAFITADLARVRGLAASAGYVTDKPSGESGAEG